MNLAKFRNQDQSIELPDYTAWFEFKTAGSIGFEMGHSPRAREKFIDGSMCIHAPCIEKQDGDRESTCHLTRFALFFTECRFASLDEEQKLNRCCTLTSLFFDAVELTPEERSAYMGDFILPGFQRTIFSSPWTTGGVRPL
ncbi:MAG: hypothetical protein P4L99_06985 [Chthoniobacter sp.]|nr:hypothetical protein [Chthoniobacter sp.]